MKYSTNNKTACTDKPIIKRSSSLPYTSTVEYSMIANLVSYQYQRANAPRFDQLLAIPLKDRIPGLIEQYGKKTMHHLLVMILKEFVASLDTPASKPFTRTRLGVLANDVMLSSYEDYLSLEDLILFLKRAREGFYGPINTLADTAQMFALLDKYRQERHEAYIQLKNGKESVLKTTGPVTRVAGEPTLINNLFHQAMVVDMNKKMSG